MAGQTVGARTATCKVCSTAFSYPARTGPPPRVCSKECGVEARQSRPRPKCSEPRCEREARAPDARLCNRHYTALAKARSRTCSVHRCDAPATRVEAQMCERHYYRRRRTGTTDDPASGRVFMQSGGYLVAHDPTHPLASKSGAVFQHRVVAYDRYGPGEQTCHWCGVSLAHG